MKLLFLSCVLLSNAVAQEVLNDDEYNDVFETSFNCTTPCGEYEFCGSDLACYSYDSCETWYELGHPTLTGRFQDVRSKTPTVDPLKCDELKDDKDLTFLGRIDFCRGERHPLALSYYEEGNNESEW